MSGHYAALIPRQQSSYIRVTLLPRVSFRIMIQAGGYVMHMGEAKDLASSWDRSYQFLLTHRGVTTIMTFTAALNLISGDQQVYY